MHPIERLRYVARAGDAPTAPLVREAAIALASFAHDPTELLTACRQLIERRPNCGPLIWMTARMLTGSDPTSEAWDAVEALERDTTERELAHAIPEAASVLVLGSPELTTAALLQRADVEVLMADTVGEGFGLLHRLDSNDHLGVDVPAGGIGAAAADVDLVLLEAEVLGGGEALARSGSLAAAAVAQRFDVAVWLVAGVGRVVPDRMWDFVRTRSIDRDPWDLDLEVLPLDLVDKVVGPSGPVPVAEIAYRIDCPVAPEMYG